MSSTTSTGMAPVAASQPARGADTLSEFNRQHDKIITALQAIDADVVGLIEIENDGYGSTQRPTRFGQRLECCRGQ